MNRMKAAVISKPGAPDAFALIEKPIPEPKPGWVLIRVHAFGMNRSEIYTRRGQSGAAVTFPRILGIECVGEVVDAGGTELAVGQTIAALMGGMGRAYDGSYAEYTLVPVSQVIPVDTSLSWHELAAVPESYMTAWGSLFDSIGLEEGETLLVRGGTSSVGMAAIAIASAAGAEVTATTRTEAKLKAMSGAGAKHVIVDDGSIAEAVREIHPEGVTHVLELVGVTTLSDSFRTVGSNGVLCVSGMLGDEWLLNEFSPFDIPSGIKLTTYNSERVSCDDQSSLQNIVDSVEAGHYPLNIDSVFTLSQIVEAHEHMDSGKATGKLVIVVSRDAYEGIGSLARQPAFSLR